jgi:hypothetical protein
MDTRVVLSTVSSFSGPRSSRVGSGCATKHLIAIYSKNQGIGRTVDVASSHSNRNGDIFRGDASNVSL